MSRRRVGRYQPSSTCVEQRVRTRQSAGARCDVQGRSEGRSETDLERVERVLVGVDPFGELRVGDVAELEARKLFVQLETVEHVRPSASSCSTAARREKGGISLSKDE